MSYVRLDTPGWNRTSVLCPRKAALASAELQAYERSLRQESNPHPVRTKGVCLPLTLRRQMRCEAHRDPGCEAARFREWRRRVSNPLLLGASEAFFQKNLIPRRCEGFGR